ncbi:MAG: hypothetical protein AB1597_04755 [Chloroflexota bacterium]
MNASVIYARVPRELKSELLGFAKMAGKPQSEAISVLIQRGLQSERVQKELADIRTKLEQANRDRETLRGEKQQLESELTIARQSMESAHRAKGHLERILNTVVGKCSVPGCGMPINLYGFAYQQCPRGHSKSIDLLEAYKKMPGVGEALVAGLAVFGGIALASELLGPSRAVDTPKR